MSIALITAVVALLVAALVFALVVILLLKAASRTTIDESGGTPPAEDPAAPSAPTAPSAVSMDLDSDFRRAVATLRAGVSGGDHRYQLPWSLMLGEAGGRPPDLLANGGLEFPLGRPDDAALDGTRACNFWFAGSGVILDLNSTFVLQGDGRSADQDGWQRTLRLLEKHRPRRPLDSLTLTVSCAALLAQGRRQGDGDIELGERAQRIAQRLHEAQARLRLRLPVYVLVTGCEALEGFADFAAALPSAGRLGMLGWSSPYHVDTVYRDEWVGEAMQQVRGRLEELQMELLVQGSAGDSRARTAFLLSDAMTELERPLSTYLRQVFAPSAYHEAMPVRGIYLCGSGEMSVPGPTGAQTATAPGALPAADLPGAGPDQTWFVRDLFERKLFREAALARPTASGLVTRNRSMRLVQAALVVLAALLAVSSALAFSRLSTGLEPLVKTLVELDQDFDELPPIRSRSEESQVERLRARERATRLLEGMSRIQIDHVDSVFLPASWGSDFEQRIEKAFERGYEELIYEGIRDGLAGKAGEIANRVVPLAGPAPADVCRPGSEIAAEQSASRIAALRVLVDDARALDDHIHLYESLRVKGHDNINDFAALADYALGLRLDRTVRALSALCVRAMYEAEGRQRFDTAAWQPRIEAKLADLLGAVHEALFYRSPLLADHGGLGGALEPLLSQGDFGALVGRIDQLARHLEGSAYDYLFVAEPSLGSSVDDLLGTLARATLVRKGSLDALGADGRTAWNAARRCLAGRSPTLGAPLLAVDPEGRPQKALSDSLRTLRDVLENARSGLDVAAPSADALLADIPAGRRLVWDTALLDRARDLFKTFEAFRQQHIARFPDTMREILERGTRKVLAANMTSLVIQARGHEPMAEPGSEQALRQQLAKQARDFGNAASRLGALVSAANEIAELEELADAIFTLLHGEGSDILRQTDTLRRRARLYEPRPGSVESWGGARPFAFHAFDVSSAEELAVYLDAQRAQITELAKVYAEPVLAWLAAEDAGVAEDHMLRRWRGIAADVHDHEVKRPGNALASLEQYITTDMVEARPPACEQGARRTRGTSFFAETEHGLQRDLRRACLEHARARAAKEYAALAEFFDRQLAGRFPFARARPDIFAAEANPVDLGRLIALLDGAQALTALQDSSHTAGSRAADRFVHSLRALRPALALVAGSGEPGAASGAAAPSDPGAAMGYDLEVAFRVEREQERGANQIIDWTLRVGEQQVSLRDQMRPLRWRPGMPVAVSLRWAANAPDVPVACLRDRAVAIQDRTITFRYNSRWSLMALLRAHAIEHSRAHTLRFDIHTRPASDPRCGPAGDDAERVAEARVYIRLALRNPADQSSIVLPMTFPDEAPAWGRDDEGGLP
jgi:type VI secretion system protein ImpL